MGADLPGDLSGRTVLVTRPSAVAEPLLELLKQAGARVVHWPALAYRSLDPQNVASAREGLLAAQHLIFSSQQAAQSALAIMAEESLPSTTSLFAVGSSTASVLHKAGYQATYPTAGNGSEALLALPEFQKVSGLKMGIVCAPGGRQVLMNTLSGKGAEVSSIETYQTEPVSIPAGLATQLDGLFDQLWITGTSGQILKALAESLNSAIKHNLLERPLVVPAARLAAYAGRLGFSQVILAEGPQPKAIARALAAHKSCDNPPR